MDNNNTNNNFNKNQRNNNANAGYESQILHELMDVQKRLAVVEVMSKSNNTATSSVVNDEKVKKLEAEINRLTEENAKVNKINKALSAQNKDLNVLAYTDVKTGVMNANAFNRDFKNVEKDETVLVVYSLCETKKTNNLYGKKAGDTLIKTVASIIAKEYGENRVYRTMGDQFYIIETLTAENSVETVVNRINALIDNDMASNRINVIAKYEEGSKSESLSDMVAKIEDKFRKESPNTPAPVKVKPAPKVEAYAEPEPEMEEEAEPMPDSQAIKESTSSIMDIFAPKPEVVEDGVEGYDEEDFDDEDLMAYMTGKE